MTQETKDTLKTVAIILAAGAAVTGLVYLLKDNEDVNDFLSNAKDKASGVWDDAKGVFDDAVGKAESKFSKNV